MAKDSLAQSVNFDQTEASKTDNNFSQEITIQDIIDAPADQWREMCDTIDANPAFIERCRARKQRADQVKPRRKQSRRSRPSTSTRHFTAASVLHSQAQIGAAMVKSLERVNNGELDGDGETRSILVTTGDATVIMEVVA